MLRIVWHVTVSGTWRSIIAAILLAWACFVALPALLKTRSCFLGAHVVKGMWTTLQKIIFPDYFLFFFCHCIKVMFISSSDFRTQESSTFLTSASTSMTPQVTWMLIAPFHSAWRQTSLSSWPPSASLAHSLPRWSLWLGALHSQTLRCHVCFLFSF